MLEGALRAKSLQTVAVEIDMQGLDKNIFFETDLSAADSFVA